MSDVEAELDRLAGENGVSAPDALNVRYGWKADISAGIFQPKSGRQAINFRANIIDWLSVLAADAEQQLAAVDGLPEELRLTWESRFFAVDERDPTANKKGLAQFTQGERRALVKFDNYMWSLPPEPDPLWHRGALHEEPWPQVRAKAAELLNRLTALNG